MSYPGIFSKFRSSGALNTKLLLLIICTMNPTLELVFFVAAVLGFLLSFSMMAQIFTSRKANFFMGLVIWILALELLFSWGYHSGYNQQANAFPFWILLNYTLIPPSVWLFVRFQTDDNFALRRWHGWLFLPFFIE